MSSGTEADQAEKKGIKKKLTSSNPSFKVEPFIIIFLR